MASVVKVFHEPDYHGVLFSCTNRESLSLYNESIIRLLKLKDPSADGDGLIRQALSKDKYFFMGYIYIASNLVFGRDATDKYDKEIESHIATCQSLIDNNKLNLCKNELLYFKALKSFYDGDLVGALRLWKEITLLNSFDILALWFLHFGYQSYGNVQGLYNSMSCVMNDWEILNKRFNFNLKTMPFIYGMYGFALNEIGDYYNAWKYTKLSLKYDESNVWSTHSLAHILEETGQPKQGIKFLCDNEKYWRHSQNYDSVSGIHHIEWHWGLYFIELSQYSNALNLFDQSYLQLLSQSGSNDKQTKYQLTDGRIIRTSVRLRDASSYLWRLELNANDFINDTSVVNDNNNTYSSIKYTPKELLNEIEDRWNLLYPFINDKNNNRFIEVYHDSYYLINLIKQKENKLAFKYIDNLTNLHKNAIKNNSKNTYYIETCRSPNGCLDIFNGLYEGYTNGNWDKAFNLFYNSFESEYNGDFWRMAGSRAQKDIFELTMIDLATKCNNKTDSLVKLHGILNQRLSRKTLAPQALNIMSKLYENKDYCGFDKSKSQLYANIREKAMNEECTMYQRPYHVDSMQLLAKIQANNHDTGYFCKL